MIDVPDFTKALCRDAPDLFFPSDDGSLRGWPARVAAAKALCNRCPALETCMAYTLRINPTHGIFAAMTPDERKYLEPMKEV
jgi:WhiB family transcriptional regulator, redox-sensing transcriptional regulator